MDAYEPITSYGRVRPRRVPWQEGRLRRQLVEVTAGRPELRNRDRSATLDGLLDRGQRDGNARLGGRAADLDLFVGVFAEPAAEAFDALGIEGPRLRQAGSV